MSATTTEGTGHGSVADIKSKIYNGTVKSENIDPSTVITSDVADGAVTTGKMADGAVTTGKMADGAVTTAKIEASAVTTAKIAANAVTTGKMKFFKSSEQTSTGYEQMIAHGLGATPGLVIVYPTDVGSVFPYEMVEGTHDPFFVKVTVSNEKKYVVVAFV